jgi:hypothetical protein
MPAKKPERLFSLGVLLKKILRNIFIFLEQNSIQVFHKNNSGSGGRVIDPGKT